MVGTVVHGHEVQYSRFSTLTAVSHIDTVRPRIESETVAERPTMIPNIVHTVDLTPNDLPTLIHPIDSSRGRLQLPIGDSTGLNKTGVHYCRLPPETTSTIVHWHTHEDEWAYIIEAGEDSSLILQKQGTVRTETVSLTAGDFIGFPAGDPTGHGFRTGNSPLIYLFGGSREPLDVCHYVETNQRLVKDRHSADWLVNNSDIVKEI